MEKIIRYKNGTLYSAQEKKFLSYKGIVARNPGEFYVVESKTENDVTAEVSFLAEVEHVKAMKAFDKARITYVLED